MKKQHYGKNDAICNVETLTSPHHLRLTRILLQKNRSYKYQNWYNHLPKMIFTNLANLINECTSDLRNGMGTRLYDLARMIDAIAESNSQDYLHVLPQAIGSFSQELLASKSMTMIPMLPKEIREKHIKTTNLAVEKATRALEELKRQLCDNDTIDFQKLMECAGSLRRHAGNLYSERRFLTPRGEICLARNNNRSTDF